MKLLHKPKITFSQEAYARLFAYARAARGEITGFGVVDESPAGLFVSEVFILEQKATAAGCQVNAGTLHQLMKWAKQENRPELAAKARLWWHSHAGFNCFRSGTDEGTVDLLLQVMPYLLCTVVNHKSQQLTSLHLKEPQRITFDRLPIYREQLDLGYIQADVEQEVQQKVTEWTYEPIAEPKKMEIISERMTDGVPYYLPHEVNDKPDKPKDPSTFTSREAEEAYLAALNSGHAEGAWDRYREEKNVRVPEEPTPGKSLFNMTEAEWDAWVDKQYPETREGA
jgi:hypothetical protein